MTPLVIVESPYYHTTRRGRLLYRNYLKACVEDSMARGEAPFASHAFYTQFLNDLDPKSRTIGMRLSRAFIMVCAFVAVYEDYGRSKGMLEGIRIAELYAKRIEFRRIK